MRQTFGALFATGLMFTLAISGVIARDGSRQRYNDHNDPRQQPYFVRDKLLIIVIDGLRWDYLSRFYHRSGKGFPGFREFMTEGVRTEYLKSVFPSESFPAWQTISTGLYPDKHGIIGNKFYDPRGRNEQDSFFNIEDARTTSAPKWWNKAEPIWATAQKQGVKFSAQLWSRCDIPWYDSHTVKLEHCESVYEKDNSKVLSYMIDVALGDFQTKGVDAAIVYEDSVGKAAEEFGPLSIETESKFRELDKHLQFMLRRLKEVNMDNNVNVIILSDHGMTYGNNPLPHHHPPGFPVMSTSVMQIHLSRQLRGMNRQVKMVVGSGAYAMIYPRDPQRTDQVVRELTRRMERFKVKVFPREEIPDRLHWRDSSYAPPILLLASPGTVLLQAGGNLQRPASRAKVYGGMYEANLAEQTKHGLSGYDPEEEDMRGVFMARGPGFFNDGSVHEAIELVDVYQIFCFLLGLEPGEHDGEWYRVRSLLLNSASRLLVSSRVFAVAVVAISTSSALVST